MREYVARVAVLLAATVLIAWFLPHEKTADYEVVEGRPWKYNSLIADYDFPIHKSPEQIKRECDSVRRAFQPYYKVDGSVEGRQDKALQKAFLQGTLAHVPRYFLPHLRATLHEIYSVGVVEQEEMHTLADNGTAAVRVVRGMETEGREVKDLFSTLSAYEYLLHADTVNYPLDVLRRCDLNNYITANFVYDKDRSEALLRDMVSSVAPSTGLVQKGEKIIDRGEIVTPQSALILQSLRKESQERDETESERHTRFLGQVLFVAILLSSFLAYLALFRKDYFDKSNCILLITTLFVAFPIATSLLLPGRPMIQYLIPFAMMGIFVRIFMDSRTAFTALTLSVLLSAVVTADPFEFILVQMTSGIIAIYGLRELTQRSQLISVTLKATLGAALMALSFDLFQGVGFRELDPSVYFHIALGGVLLLFAYPLLFVLEKTFGFTSDVTLIELSNINHPLLRKMSKVAQGTFNHSLQVANLAADVAGKIGAKVQMVRTGALYHDIGKIENAAFFTENQHGQNPHDSLDEEKSAAVIISHVTEGLKLAEKYGLPKDVRAFIATHHGKSKTKYFYITYRNKHPEGGVNESSFTYPGPNPFTREQAILMMADTIEAASRSLKDYSEESLRELVERLVTEQMNEGYFLSCPITFKDIALAKEVFIENLKTIYHTRISYPELKEKKEMAGRSSLSNFIITGLHRNRS